MKKSFLSALLESFIELAGWIIALVILFVVAGVSGFLLIKILPEEYAFSISTVLGIWFAYTYGNRLVGEYFEFERGIKIGKIALGLTIIFGAGYALFINVPLWAFIISILLVLILLVLVLIAFK